MSRASTLSLFIGLALAAAGPVCAHAPAAVSPSPYPGTITLHVDASDTARRIFTVHQEFPVSAGPLRLHYPQWLPGTHAARGPVDQIGGLVFSANGQVLPWRRDPLDMYSFLVDVPAGASTLNADFQFLSPLDPNQGRVVVTPEILGLQWNMVTLYPAGFAARTMMVQPSVTLPAGWQLGTALEVASQAGVRTQFKATDVDTLIDSPLLAGKHFRRFDLNPGAAQPVHLDVVADSAKELAAKPEILAQHRTLVQQAYKLFGAPHFRHYDFLLSISSRYASIGLEHQQSSENGVGAGYLTDLKNTRSRDLLAHEMTHSWNGKYRRGADSMTMHFNEPMQDSLLWVYEGQTQYWGNVLSVRAGMRDAARARDALASVAAGYQHREGRRWRTLLDTTNQPVISARRPQGWRSWQRGEDYYAEGELIWLDVDTLIREKTGDKRSLDDFARAFFGAQPGRIETLPYTFEDVVAALNGVVAHDWATFLRDRVEKTGDAPLDGLARSGWKLVYTDEPSATMSAGESRAGGADLTYSLGLGMARDMKISDVLWNGPAFKAGLAGSMTIVAVNGIAASPDALKEAVTEAKSSKQPIVLLVNNLDHIETVRIPYYGGLRYPHLERLPGTRDRLADIHAARK